MRCEDLMPSVRLDERKLNLVTALEPYKDDPNIFITFSEVMKVGINPASPYDTPVGIYAYPLAAVWDQVVNDTLPFATERPFVHVLRNRGHLLDVVGYTDADLTRDIDRLREIVFYGSRGKGNDTMARDKIAFGWFNKAYDALEPEQAAKIDNFMEHNRNLAFDKTVENATRDALVQTASGYIWNITRVFSERLKAGQRSFVVWNSVLRMLGYDGAVDARGLGVIHSNEPFQAVFLTSKAVQHVATVDNHRQTKIDPTRSFVTFTDFANFLVWLNDFGYDDEDAVNAKGDKQFKMKKLVQQWSTLMTTGQSANFAINDPQEFRQEMMRRGVRFVRTMLQASDILAPVAMHEILTEPALTPAWSAFVDAFSSNDIRKLRLLLTRDAIEMQAKTANVTPVRARRTLSEKVLMLVTNYQETHDLDKLKKKIEPIRNLFSPETVTDAALRNLIEMRFESPF